MDKTYISAEEFARLVNLAKPTVYNLARNGLVESQKVNGTLLFSKESVENYLKRPILSNELVSKETSKKIIDYWMIPRSVRKLVGIQEMIKNDYRNGIIGGQWKGSRVNHLQRDQNLQESGLRGKTVNGFVDANPGGARTDVALLSALGFYAFDEQGCIELTYQGEQMLTSTNPASIITQQLLQFRYPSPYSRSIGMAEDINIFPYRFLLKLLLEERLMDTGNIVAADNSVRITQNEIALYVIPQARTQDDFEKVVNMILDGRKSSSQSKPSDKMINIANTFINNLEITTYIARGRKSSIMIRDEKLSEVLEALDKNPRSFTYVVGKENEFQHRLGMDPSKTKYTRPQTSNRTSGELAVKHLLIEELKNNPMVSEDLTDDFVNKIALHAGTSSEIASAVINSHLTSSKPEDIFSNQYKTYASSGRTFARDFEISTKKIFDELLGIGNAKWTGKEGKSPDVTFTLVGKNCILDCKAESNYNISNDHFNRMTAVETGYIPAYKADVFIYVANNFGSNFIKNLTELQHTANIPGSGITADALLRLLDASRNKKIDEKQLLNLFSTGRIIRPETVNTFLNSVN